MNRPISMLLAFAASAILGSASLSAQDSVNYQRTVDQVFGECRDKEAIIVDIRFNRGGLLHDQLAALFTGKVVAEFITREGINVATSPPNAGANPPPCWPMPAVTPTAASSRISTSATASAPLSAKESQARHRRLVDHRPRQDQIRHPPTRREGLEKQLV